jgi:uncharacterized protein (DUF302 family)
VELDELRNLYTDRSPMNTFETIVERPLEQVEPDVRAALAAEGFGVLTEIDVAATLKAKLGVERPPLRILGACNPTLVNEALKVDPSVSLLLPCNVVLEATPTGTKVSVVDPAELLGGPGLAELAADATARLAKVIRSIS